MPRMLVSSIFGIHLSICRRLIDFFWLHTLHDQRCARVLLKRQQGFMLMQRQQSQWHGLLVEREQTKFVFVNDWRML